MQNFKNNNIYNLNSNFNNTLKTSLKKNSNEIKISNSTLKELLSSSHKNTDNNSKVYKEQKYKLNDGINEFEKKYLLKNQIKSERKNNFDITNNNNLLDNISFNKDDNNNKNSYNNNFIKNNNTNNINPINQVNFVNNKLNLNNLNTIKNLPNIINQKNSIKNNILIKSKKHISFNLDNNIFIKFRKDDFITKSEITTQNGEIYNHPKKDMTYYQNELKLSRPKPIIKTFLTKDIKINKDYILVENLPERQILPDLYDDFEEDDLKSLEKSLERSVDKIIH